MMKVGRSKDQHGPTTDENAQPLEIAVDINPQCKVIGASLTLLKDFRFTVFFSATNLKISSKMPQN
eukprot:1267652-Amphidinium_carterae.1